MRLCSHSCIDVHNNFTGSQLVRFAKALKKFKKVQNLKGFVKVTKGTDLMRKLVEMGGSPYTKWRK